MSFDLSSASLLGEPMDPYALRRGALATLSAGFVLLAAAVPASAHVGVSPDSAAPGGYTTLTFRVPDELPDTSTVKVEVALPEDQPLAHVSVKPVPGWTTTTVQRALPKPVTTDDGTVTTAVSRIVWAGGKIEPGQFQEFEVSAGPLPDHGDSMVFKVLQTYGTGQVARWIDAPTSDGSEPEHPAPVLRLAKSAEATAGSASATTPVTANAKAAATEETAAATAAQHDGSARLLGGAALAVAILGTVVAAAGRRRPVRGGRP